MVRSNEGGDRSASAPVVVVFALLRSQLLVQRKEALSKDSFVVLVGRLRMTLSNKTHIASLVLRLRQQDGEETVSATSHPRKQMKTSTPTCTFHRARQTRRRTRFLRFPQEPCKSRECPTPHATLPDSTSIVILHPCIEQLYALIPFAS